MACILCRNRKLKCNLKQPCETCIKAHRRCIYRDPPSTPYTVQETPPSATPISPAESDPAQLPSPKATQESPASMSPFDNNSSFFDIGAFDIDPFASMLPFWPDPLLLTPVAGPTCCDTNQLSRIAFDDFDRSRLIHELQAVPQHLRGHLPPPFRLTTILHQYFTHVNPLLPFTHPPSFSVSSCPTLYLLLLLAIGDVYSEERTVDKWARKTFRYLMRNAIERYENSEEDFPITSIQALNMWVSELTYSSDPSTILLANHCRVTLAHICQQLQAEEDRESRIHAPEYGEASWVIWIQRETRRRTLMSIYLTETSASMYLGVAPMLKLSELRVPFPESNEIWCADTYEQWQQLRRISPLGTPVLHFHEVLSRLMETGEDLISQCSGVVGLHVVAIGLQEMIEMARKLRGLNGQGHLCSAFLRRKSREGLEAWKASWQTNQLSATKAQYTAIMSAWCCAELSITAPDFILSMVYRVSTCKDLRGLTTEFLSAADDEIKTMDLDKFNNLMSAAAASLFHVEAISEFNCLKDCISTMRSAVYPNVTTSVFVGALCLWFSLKAVKQLGRSMPDGERKEISPRLLKAMGNIRWARQAIGSEDSSIIGFLGTLLLNIKIWGEIC